MSDSIIEIKNVRKTYFKKEHPVYALDGVDLSIRKGEVLSLLGVNGAGKTTLSSILATLHPVTSGEILFEGVSIYKNLSTYRSLLGYCPQHPNLDSYLTVRDNLIFAGRYYLMPQDHIVERADYLMKQFNLTRYANFNINALSGGYKQRLSIARALMHKPRVVILDEPTVGLDPNIRRQLWSVITSLKNEGITVILTTHYLDEAEQLSDRACILHRGKILLIESIAEIKGRDRTHTFEDIFIDLTKLENE
jgi:ABC-2 type transport system ATP-binding protein